MADVGVSKLQEFGAWGSFCVRRVELGVVGEIRSPVSDLPEVSLLAPHPETTNWYGINTPVGWLQGGCLCQPCDSGIELWQGEGTQKS